MKFVLQRKNYRSDGIFGELLKEDGSKFCDTLEHAYRSQDGYDAKVGLGIYQCVRKFSPRFDLELFVLKNVPGHTDIEIHPGNYNGDSEGCVLLGDGIAVDATGGWAIKYSRVTFNHFMTALDGIDSFFLTVQNAPETILP